jgi:hypothetical protein
MDHRGVKEACEWRLTGRTVQRPAFGPAEHRAAPALARQHTAAMSSAQPNAPPGGRMRSVSVKAAAPPSQRGGAPAKPAASKRGSVEAPATSAPAPAPVTRGRTHAVMPVTAALPPARARAKSRVAPPPPAAKQPSASVRHGTRPDGTQFTVIKSGNVARWVPARVPAACGCGIRHGLFTAFRARSLAPRRADLPRKPAVPRFNLPAVAAAARPDAELSAQPQSGPSPSPRTASQRPPAAGAVVSPRRSVTSPRQPATSPRQPATSPRQPAPARPPPKDHAAATKRAKLVNDARASVYAGFNRVFHDRAASVRLREDTLAEILQAVVYTPSKGTSVPAPRSGD